MPAGKVSGAIAAMQAQLFKRETFVCGGHGARWPGVHAHFTIPKGITLHFYCDDATSLDNVTGQKVDGVLSGGAAPAAHSTYGAGDRIWDYHLFSSKAGGYLNLGMSTRADSRYITCDDKDQGIALSKILKTIINTTPYAEVHWSACRAIESKDDKFDWDKPSYSGALATLAGKAGKI